MGQTSCAVKPHSELTFYTASAFLCSLFIIVFGEKNSFYQSLTAAFVKKKKKYEKKVIKSPNKFLLSFIIHMFNSMPYFNPCLLSYLKCYQDGALLFLQLIILLSFKVNLKLTSKLHSRNIKHLTLQRDYKWSTFNSLPCTSKIIFLINCNLHTLNIMCFCSQVLCSIRGLTFGQSRRPIISWEPHLLWSVFHCCLLFALTCVYTIW